MEACGLNVILQPVRAGELMKMQRKSKSNYLKIYRIWKYMKYRNMKYIKEKNIDKKMKMLRKVWIELCENISLVAVSDATFLQTMFRPLLVTRRRQISSKNFIQFIFSSPQIVVVGGWKLHTKNIIVCGWKWENSFCLKATL